jgi:integrase
MRGHIRERSPGHWAIIFDMRDPATGRRKRKWHSFKGTKRAAQAECARLLTVMNTGGYVETTRLTVERFMRDRLALWEASGRIGSRTLQRYRELVENQINPLIGEIRIQKLTTLDIERWHASLRVGGRKGGQHGVNTRTIRHAHTLLSQVLAEAMKHGLVVRNVATVQSPPKVDSDEVQIVGADRLKELLARLDGHPLYPKAALGLFAGLRRGEVMALRWHHVDLDRRVLQVRDALEETRAYGIRVKPPKSKAGRRDIAMADILVDALRAHRQAQLELRLRLGLGKLSGDDLLFPNIDGGLTSPQQLSSQWFVFAKSIGMRDVTFHALRHTHVAQLIDAGVDVMMIAKRLGHARASTTLNHYGHLFRSTDDKAAAAINSAIKGW